MTHVTPGPLVLGDTRNEYNDGYAWVVPVWADVSPNCIYAEARHENRTEARKRAALIVKAVNVFNEAKAALEAAYEELSQKEVDRTCRFGTLVMVEAVLAKMEGRE